MSYYHAFEASYESMLAEVFRMSVAQACSPPDQTGELRNWSRHAEQMSLIWNNKLLPPVCSMSAPSHTVAQKDHKKACSVSAQSPKGPRGVANEHLISHQGLHGMFDSVHGLKPFKDLRTIK